MPLKVLVKSKYRAITEEPPEEPHIIISIYTPGDRKPEVKTNKNTALVSYYCFADLDHPPSEATIKIFPSLKSKEALFSKKMAINIAETMAIAKAEKINTIVVHCDMGLSRSAAVAAAIEKFYNRDDSKYFSSGPMYGKPMYTPNMLVYRMMLEALVMNEE